MKRRNSGSSESSFYAEWTIDLPDSPLMSLALRFLAFIIPTEITPTLAW